MKKMETPSKDSLHHILQEIQAGRYVIPNFQREFEWSAWAVADLIESIIKDYFIGTLLLWHASPENVDSLSCEPLYAFAGTSKPEHIVLDGQQRLSALHYAFFAPNKKYPNRSKRCFFFIRLNEYINENYEETVFYEWDYKNIIKLYEDKEEQFEKKIIPLSLFTNEKDDYRDWLEGYEKYWLNKGIKDVTDEKVKIRKLFDELLHEYEISYIELDKKIDVAKVCDIFTKINSTGLNLDIFDLLNAILTPKNIFLKKYWRESNKEFNEFSDIIEARAVLQVMSILKQGYCSPSYLYYLVPKTRKVIRTSDGSREDVVLIDSKEEFDKLWNVSVEKIKEGIEILASTKMYGAISSRFLPYPSMIPIFAALQKEKDVGNYADKLAVNEKIKKWYWTSVFTQNYSSAVESQMARDFMDMKEWFKDDNAVPRVVTQFINDFNHFSLKDENNERSAVYIAIFNLLILKGAKDWGTFNLPEFSNLHDHHIVPKTWIKMKGDKLINNILNRTPLADATNRDMINDEMPNVYLKNILKKAKNQDTVYKMFESHMISRKAVDILMRDDFNKDDYEEFISEREKTILVEIKNLLGISSIQPLEKKQIDVDKDYEKIIIKGEGEYIEFKSSMRIDSQTHGVNKDIEHAIAKTISSFLNSDGGTLLIGVDDNGNLLGLENDYNTFKKKNRDGFRLHLIEIINHYIGKGTHQFVQCEIINIKDKDVCIVELSRSDKPVYVNDDEFYIRASASSQPLNKKQTIEYTKTHWKE